MLNSMLNTFLLSRLKQYIMSAQFNYLLLALLIIISASNVWAKNIDLSTLPSRDSVQLTIYNAEDLTLVRETRQISIKKGHNRLQFSWANTRIDPSSVQLNFVTHAQSMALRNTTYPHDKPQMLYWHIDSSENSLTTVEISYFTSGIRWQANYSAILSNAADTMTLDSFVTVTNQSGEDYENAQIRLVIGHINLLESVNDLVARAQYKMQQLHQSRRSIRKKTVRKAMNQAVGRYAAAPVMAMEKADSISEEKQIAKEAISEYYIFAIEGTENIPDKWAKRMRSGAAKAVKINTVYRYRPREYGPDLVRVLIFNNNKASSLGDAPLPAGNIQIYQQGLNNRLNYLAGVTLDYTSINDKVELNTGVNPQIIFSLVNLKNWRDNIWMHYKKTNIYRKISNGHINIDHNSRVAGWDEHRVFVQHIRNYSDSAINIEIRRLIAGDALFRSQLQVTKYDFQTLMIHSQLAAGEQQELLYETQIKKGRNSKHNQLLLQQQKIDYPFSTSNE